MEQENALRTPKVNLINDIVPRSVDWLWEDKIARGRITLIAGDPGIGKSWLSLDIASRVSNGTPWPDGKTCEKGRVILLNCEDDFADTVRPRLDLLGADIKNIYELEGIQEEEGVSQVSFEDVDMFESVIDSYMPSLIIVDPVSAYFGQGTDNYRDTAVRNALRPLAEMIMESGVALLLVAHLNKSSDQQGLYRVSGSIQFSGAARTTYVVTVDPKNPERRLMVCAKNNLGPARFGHGYSIDPEAAEPIMWEPDALPDSDLEALLPIGGRRDDDTDEIQLFLEREAEKNKGVLLPGEVKKSTSEGGYQWSSVQRARRHAGFTAIHRNNGWLWVSPSHPDAGPWKTQE